QSFTNPYFLQLYFTLRKINRIHKIKIIHSAPIYLTANLFAFQFSKKRNIPFICTPLFHIRSLGNYFFSPSFQYILRNTDAIIACTDYEKKFYQKYGIASEKIHVIPPGIEPKNYQKSSLSLFRQQYNIPNNAPLLFFLGRRSYTKGIMNVIYALNYLIKKFKNIILIIAGPSTYEYKMFQKTIPQNLKKHIIDLGVIDESTKIEALSNCDVFLLPSLDDAFGIVYLEAWFFKKPVIGALEGNVAGLIDNNVNGLLIPFNNIKLLWLRIEEILENKKQREVLGDNGYNKLINNFLLKDTNKQMLDLYNKFT
ncbi:MAG: glycosyltransferase family 4 protein, partial [Candidatus Thorarchaeota archaeon]